MRSRRFLLASIAVCLTGAAIVAAFDLRSAFRGNPQSAKLTPGATPLISIDNPADAFASNPADANAEFPFLVEPADHEDGSGSPAVRASDTRPAELPKTVPLARVPLMSAARREAIVAMIRRHLPDASNDEQRYWLEETRGLSHLQVEELLQMRTQVGSLVGPLHGNEENPRTGRPAEADARTVLQQARRIALGNLMNADSIGYRSIEVTFAGSAATDGGPFEGSSISIACRTVAPAQGTLIATGRALDVAIQGDGFLLVKWNGETRVTRFGRLKIDAERKLALDVRGAPVRPFPEIELPSGVDSVRVIESGQIAIERPDADEWESAGKLTLVAVPFPEHLRPAESGTYAVTPRSGEPRNLIPGTESGSVLHPRTLEGSNVDRESEEQRLEWLEKLSEQLERNPS